MESESMDVDPHPSGSDSSRMKRPSPPASFPTDKRHKGNPIQAELSAELNGMSDGEKWSSRMAEAGDDEVAWKNLITRVLSDITGVLATTDQKASFISHQSYRKAMEIVEGFSDDELKEWMDGVRKGVKDGDWEDLVHHPKLQATISSGQGGWRSDNRDYNLQRLVKAYSAQFIGDAASTFVDHLRNCDKEARANKKIYAKSISVVQSSGTGKSRMLTEVGKQIFTLPICLRSPSDPGYPPSDENVYNYFKGIRQRNYLSLETLWSIACFLAAAHEMMLGSLQEMEKREGRDMQKVLLSWHGHMEHEGQRAFRQDFFERVVRRAHELNSTDSPKRGADGKPEGQGYSLIGTAKEYGSCARKATVDLMKFLKNLSPVDNRLCVTYFDEAHELGLSFWILLRLLQAQEPSTRMWYVFMGTKSSISYYAPTPENQLSLKLRDEVSQLVPPYIALGFDQHAIDRDISEHFPVQDFETIDHLSYYGRPLWRASLEIIGGDELVDLAAAKLVNNGHISFDARDKNQVFVVVSQRLCLDPVLAGTEAIQLADRSVANHMRLLSGFSDNHSLFYTHSPSEPLLVLGAARVMYDPNDHKRLGKILATLSKELCGASLVDKGHLGELCARVLLLTARDYAAPIHDSRRNLLKPVRLLDVLHKLIGTTTWASSNQEQFNLAFTDAFVNFTHWTITRDSLPETPTKKLLSNLWSRGAILQCCHNQSSIDSLCVVYFGSVSPGAKFDPNKLGGFVLQVKNKIGATTPEERIVRPIGIPCDLDQPLPYLTFVMELGNDSSFQDTQSKIKTTVSGLTAPGQFRKLMDDWTAAVDKLAQYRRSGSPTKTRLKELNEDTKLRCLQMEDCNRYSVFVRGASPMAYGILKEADIINEFDNLLAITMPPPPPEAIINQHMRPLERLDETSPWMSEFT